MDPPAFRKSQYYPQLTRNSFLDKTFLQSGQCPSFPVITRCGGDEPGQNRDKFLTPDRIAFAFSGLPCRPRARRRKKNSKRRLSADYGEDEPAEFKQNQTIDLTEAPPVSPVSEVVDSNEIPVAGFFPLPDGPLPRPKRQRRRAKEDRGLAPDDELARLAKTYLELQRKHWPELAKSGVLPKPIPEVIAAMVEDFKHRHRTGQVTLESVHHCLPLDLKCGGAYMRYSCDNSDPTSIVDQMTKVLDKAKQENRFVPWCYAFADYSVSGLKASRRGYTSYKRVLTDDKHRIETTYVDDFSRMSRDEIEWWKLAHRSRKLRKRMIGASDGFDLSSPDSDMKIALYGLFSRLFIKSLREKVRRGQQGAARRKTCLGKPALGFTRCVCRDQNGNVVYKRNGRPICKLCIDPVTSPARLLMYELFSQKCWSPYQITKHFNELKVDGWNGWTESAVRRLLWSATAIGVFIWNKKRREFNPETEEWELIKNPRSEWDVYYEPKLAIVPQKLWCAARRRLAAMRHKSKNTGRKPSRNENSATTLFSGTLYCGYCGRELTLNRSTAKYKVMFCLNGPTGGHGCKLSTSKSVRIIETCLLTFVRDALLSEEAVKTLVSRANRFLASEAKKPRTDTVPIKRSIRDKERTIKLLFKRIEGQENEHLCRAYEKRIGELQKELDSLRTDLRQADQNNLMPPARLDLKRVKSYCADLRELLNREIPAAADALKLLTGRITVRQELIPGRNHGGRWIATFSPNLLALLRRIGREKDYPDCMTLEYLCRGNWITPENVEIRLEHTPKYEQWAQEVAEKIAKGTSVITLATLKKTSWETIRDARDFALTGKRPKARIPGTRKRRTERRPWIYVSIADEVSRLRNRKEIPFEEIARRLKVSQGTVHRAYDYKHPDAIRIAAEHGEPPKRGRYSHLGPNVVRRIRELLAGKIKPKDVAAKLDCSPTTVYRVRRGAVPYHDTSVPAA